MKTLQPVPRWLVERAAREKEELFPARCSQHSVADDVTIDGVYYPPATVSCCSHWDHCERAAVIWLYTPLADIEALCQTCYDFSFPCRTQWYRVVKISPEFHGAL